jgi:hypothetical protein
MARAETDLPAIKPESVDIEATLYSRSAHVRLPAGITPQDVHDWPQLWAEVQATNKALRRFDRVRLIAHDEAFLIRMRSLPVPIRRVRVWISSASSNLER